VHGPFDLLPFLVDAIAAVGLDPAVELAKTAKQESKKPTDPRA
jgi:hypothetical protein